jgi:hypothetical protein
MDYIVAWAASSVIGGMELADNDYCARRWMFALFPFSPVRRGEGRDEGRIESEKFVMRASRFGEPLT